MSQAHTRESLKALLPRGPSKVDLPSGMTFVRSLTVGERTAFELAMFDEDGERKADVRARLIVACACDDAGKQLFRESDVEDINDMDTSLLEPIYDAACKHNCMMHHAKDAAKNSESIPS